MRRGAGPEGWWGEGGREGEGKRERERSRSRVCELQTQENIKGASSATTAGGVFVRKISDLTFP